MAKLKPKAAKLEKNMTHTDNRKAGNVKRKAGNVKRGDYKEYVKWFHSQGFTCLECGSPFIEADHVIAQDDRTIVPFCHFCHRGDERQNRDILSKTDPNTKEKYDKYNLDKNPRNTFHFVTKGFYRTRGSRMKEFKERWPDSKLLEIASKLYQKQKDEQ